MNDEEVRKALFELSTPSVAKPAKEFSSKEMKAELFQSTTSKSGSTVKSQCNAAIFFDCDKTLLIDGWYRENSEWKVESQFINRSKWLEMNALAIKYNVALYILTARKDLKYFVDELTSYLLQTQGFRLTDTQAGGFHRISQEDRDNIDLLSPELKIDAKIASDDFIFFTRDYQGNIVLSKLDIILRMHYQKLGHLSKQQILFVDDLKIEIDPVKNKGYETVTSEVDGSHLDKAMHFIKSWGEGLVLDGCVDEGRINSEELASYYRPS